MCDTAPAPLRILLRPGAWFRKLDAERYEVSFGYFAEGIAPDEVLDEPAGIMHCDTFTPHNPLAARCWQRYQQALQVEASRASEACQSRRTRLLRLHAKSLRPRRTLPLYFIQAEPAGPVKIGLTKNVARRLATLQNGSPVKLALLHALPVRSWRDEVCVHRRFAAQRLQGEWFAGSAELLAFIQQVKRAGIEAAF